MTLSATAELLNDLNKYKCLGNKQYKRVNALLQSEANTHNLNEAIKLLHSLKGSK